MKRKRCVGLCFSCDERYTPDHRCQKSQLLLIEGLEEEDDDSEQRHDTEEAEITLQALTRSDSPKMIHTIAETHCQKLITLIDSGATHNFINEKTAHLLNLQLTPTKPFKVRVADGFPLQCACVYRKVTMMIGGVPFQIDIFPLPLTWFDMVLGMQWLFQLGLTLCDWRPKPCNFHGPATQRLSVGFKLLPSRRPNPKIVTRRLDWANLVSP